MVIAEDGYADGGRPYTREELDTINYRTDQIEKVVTRHPVYNPKLKIVQPEGKQTNWMDITAEELQAVKAILIKRTDRYECIGG